ncbi:hypothetical protein Y032_0025g1193 [Ancylostoma ceylanicum]|uniref:Uncharacterized protein n=1 Tax=Ancylostoma ceylanicum TaxID=53326 RepID=A0A016UVV8_9BILA|nr:hypothetical protein Y032_0025g1193 [Ancylostoma ceylanicum]
MGPPWRSSGENAKLRVLLGQGVRNTPGYGSALARQWRKRQGTDPPWRSSGENAKLRVLLGQGVRKTPGYRSALARQ